MMVDRAPNLQFAQQLERASQQIASLKKECLSEDKRISIDVLALVETLKECNKTIKVSANKPNEEIVNSINHFLKEAGSFPFLVVESQKSIIERVNGLQNGLFSALFSQIEKLETNLRKWRTGDKVESTHKSKQAGYNES